MFDYLLRRLGGTVLVLFCVSLFAFGFVRLLPGDPARLLSGPDATQPEVEMVRATLGLDKPVWQQYARYVVQTAEGDLGRSARTGQSVATAIDEHFMPTLLLTVVAMAWSTVLGVALGVVSGVRRGQWQDQLGMVLAVSGISFPAFWLGLLLIDLFAVRLHWLPTGGETDWRSFLMPGFTLGVGVAAVMARFTRSAFVEVSAEDYVRTARMKGLGERVVVWKHTLRNALIPVITMAGLQFGFLLGGSIVIETVFNWPGCGRLLNLAIFRRDIPEVQACILVLAFLFVILNLAVDIGQAIIDPRIRR